MLAKGRLLGIQFETLFTPAEDTLPYLHVSRHAIRQAQRIKDTLTQKGYPLSYPVQANLTFVTLPNETLQRLSSKYSFSTIATPDETHTTVRIATSWATTPEAVTTLLHDL
jgi:threonine aldolase